MAAERLITADGHGRPRPGRPPRASLPGAGPVMAKIGYARVSTRGQNDDSQVDDLTAYGCEKIFTDTASARKPPAPSSTGPWLTCARATSS
jgi:hypothetical protein